MERVLLLGSPTTMTTNHVMGTSPITHTDLTPLAVLFGEYLTFTVKADSQIKSGRDLLERLKKDPSSLSIAVGNALGNGNHITLGRLLKAVDMPWDGDFRKSAETRKYLDAH